MHFRGKAWLSGFRLPGFRASIGRALVLDDHTPRPDRDSGSLSALNLMRLLQDIGYRVEFLPAEDMKPVEGYTESLRRLGIACHGAPRFSTAGQALIAFGDVFDLIVLSRHSVARRHIETVRRCCPGARIIFRPVDLHFLREARRASVEGSRDLAKIAEQVKSVELSLAGAADATIVVSRYEEELLRHECPGARIATIPLIRDIPGRRGGPRGRRDVVFLGYFPHLPNLDAMQWWLTDIFPLLRRHLSDVAVHIVGEQTAASLACLGPLAERAGREAVVLHGRVPDLTSLLSDCRLSVAPLRWGTGLKGKVATSLCHGLPCVATSIAIEGSGLEPGREILEANETADFVNAVLDVYRDDSLWMRLSGAGLAAARRQFSFAANAARLRSLLAEMGAPARRPE
jgi:glycosyltransferase involved in cell wall biosynthesis